MTVAAAARTLVLEPLTAAAFSPFGDVIEAAGDSFPINAGACDRFHDRARMDFIGDGRAGTATDVGSDDDNEGVLVHRHEGLRAERMALDEREGQRQRVGAS